MATPDRQDDADEMPERFHDLWSCTQKEQAPLGLALIALFLAPAILLAFIAWLLS